MKNIGLIYDEITKERQHQNMRWGGAVHDDKHSTQTWVAFIVAYLGRAVGDSTVNWGRELLNVRPFFVKVAALAVAAIQSIDRKAFTHTLWKGYMSWFRIQVEDGGSLVRLIYTGETPISRAQAVAMSIAKWKQILYYYERLSNSEVPYLKSGSSGTCGLCLLVRLGVDLGDDIGNNYGCDDCPIRIVTGVGGCADTPNQDYENIDRTPMGSKLVDAEVMADLARRELLFLDRVLVRSGWVRGAADDKEKN